MSRAGNLYDLGVGDNILGGVRTGNELAQTRQRGEQFDRELARREREDVNAQSNWNADHLFRVQEAGIRHDEWRDNFKIQQEQAKREAEAYERATATEQALTPFFQQLNMRDLGVMFQSAAAPAMSGAGGGGGMNGGGGGGGSGGTAEAGMANLAGRGGGGIPGGALQGLTGEDYDANQQAVGAMGGGGIAGGGGHLLEHPGVQAAMASMQPLPPTGDPAKDVLLKIIQSGNYQAQLEMRRMLATEAGKAKALATIRAITNHQLTPSSLGDEGLRRLAEAALEVSNPDHAIRIMEDVLLKAQQEREKQQMIGALSGGKKDVAQQLSQLPYENVRRMAETAAKIQLGLVRDPATIGAAGRGIDPEQDPEGFETAKAREVQQLSMQYPNASPDVVSAMAYKRVRYGTVSHEPTINVTGTDPIRRKGEVAALTFEYEAAEKDIQTALKAGPGGMLDPVALDNAKLVRDNALERLAAAQRFQQVPEKVSPLPKDAPIVINGKPTTVSAAKLSQQKLTELWEQAQTLWAQKNGMEPGDAIDRGLKTQQQVQGELKAIHDGLVSKSSPR